MKPLFPIATLSLVAAMALPAAAYERNPLKIPGLHSPLIKVSSHKGDNGNKGNKQKANKANKAHGKSETRGFGATSYTIADCPPGLAKKNPPCIPPGLAKKSHPYQPGDHLSGDYRVIDGGHYGWDPRYGYYRQDGYVIQVDRQTMQVIGLMGAVADLLN